MDWISNHPEVQATKYSFRVPPDAGPDDTLALLKSLEANQDTGFATLKALSDWAETEYGAGGHVKDAPKIAKILRLLARPQLTNSSPTRTSVVYLTDLGRQLLRLPPERYVEFMHFLLYSDWDTQPTASRVALWSYRAVCDVLWAHMSINVSAMSQLITNDVLDKIEVAFPRIDKTASFDTKSVRGVLKWLERLEPPAVQQRVFRRRASCSAELMLLALGWVYRDVLPAAGADVGGPADLLLTAERREALCRVCLLDPAYLDRLLDWTVSVYPRYIGEGTRAGSLGRFLRLYRAPRLEDSDWII